MAGSEWAFLLDENVGRDVANELTEYGYRAELVVDVLAPGADDYPDVLPYAREHDLVVLTKDFSDFSAIDSDAHEGVILIVHHTHTPAEMAAGVDAIAEAYPSRDSFRGRQEYLDDWIR
jgi:predicted nuclease of predicted toxin-antitoxin system